MSINFDFLFPKAIAVTIIEDGINQSDVEKYSLLVLSDKTNITIIDIAEKHNKTLYAFGLTLL